MYAAPDDRLAAGVVPHNEVIPAADLHSMPAMQQHSNVLFLGSEGNAVHECRPLYYINSPTAAPAEIAESKTE